VPGQAIAATAPTNKSLAQRSKSLDTGKATKKLPRRSDPARPLAVQVRRFDVRGSLGRDSGINRPMERNPMSLHFRRSTGLGRLVRLDLSKSGLNLSAGGAGCTVNFDRNGIRSRVGVPGTGLSYCNNLPPRQHAYVRQAAVVAQPTAVEERFWQAVALEIAEGFCKAVLLMGSIVAGIVLGIVVAAMSSQL
jgi:hypothetical protein